MKINDDGTIVFESQAEVDAAAKKANEGLYIDLKAERTKRQELETGLAAVQSELSTIKADKAAADAKVEQARLEGKGDYEAALAKQAESHQAQVAELNGKIEALNTRLNEELVDKAILTVAGDAIKPDQAMREMKAAYDIIVTDKGVEVKTKDGNPVLGDDGKPLNVEQAYSKWAEGNPHMIKADAQGGGGSTPHTPGVQAVGDLRQQIAAAAKAVDAGEPGAREQLIKLKLQASRLSKAT